MLVGSSIESASILSQPPVETQPVLLELHFERSVTQVNPELAWNLVVLSESLQLLECQLQLVVLDPMVVSIQSSTIVGLDKTDARSAAA